MDEVAGEKDKVPVLQTITSSKRSHKITILENFLLNSTANFIKKKIQGFFQ